MFYFLIFQSSKLFLLVLKITVQYMHCICLLKVLKRSFLCNHLEAQICKDFFYKIDEIVNMSIDIKVKMRHVHDLKLTKIT